MSKAVQRDFDPNREKFLELLNEAKGGRSQQQFAADCNLSISYMSRIFNSKYSDPPVPSTLKKLAGTDSEMYERLLFAAGYSPSKYIPESELKNVNNMVSIDFEKRAIATISSYLMEKNIQALLVKGNAFSDLIVEPVGGPKKYYEFIQHDEAFPYLKKRLEVKYGRLALNVKEKGLDYTFVTDSEMAFEHIKSNKPAILDIHISVMLINPVSLTVLKEEVVS